MRKTENIGPWQKFLERLCRVLGISLVIDKLGCSSSEDYRLVLVSLDSMPALSPPSTKLVQIRKKNNDVVVYKAYESTVERACKRHLLEMLGNDLEIWKDGRGIEVDFLMHVPETVDGLKMQLDLAEGPKEVAEKPKT